MAVTRKQYMVRIIHIDDVVAVKNWYVFNEKLFDLVLHKSKKVLMSECRLFRMFCHGFEDKSTLRRDENGRVIRDEEGIRLYDTEEVRSAKEFVIIDMSNTKEKAHEIETILRKGLIIKKKDGSETNMGFANPTLEHVNRVVRSSSMVRVHKLIATSLPVEEVRRHISYGADFGSEVVIAQMESRYGLAVSSSISIDEEEYTFDIMPDYSIERQHDVKIWNEKKQKLELNKNFINDYSPLDGQGTMLPSAAVRTAHRLALISYKERIVLLKWLLAKRWNENVQAIIEDIYSTHENPNSHEFVKAWKKIPSAFQIRYALTKGLVVVFNHKDPKFAQDCEGMKYRTDGKCMSFWKEKGDVVVEDGETRHYYDFNADILFTDSQWKANFNPEYLTGKYDVFLIEQEEYASKDEKGKAITKKRPVKVIGSPRLEIVLWQKDRLNETIFMGYQYWQAMSTINVKDFADRKIKELKDTIFTDWKEAVLFLGQYDTGHDTDEYENKMDGAVGKIQKAIMMLNENPEMIEERWIQDVIRETRRKYIDDMKTGRIAVHGFNPYIITAPELQFGVKSPLKKGEYYHNGIAGVFALFRSPLIHKSEAITVKTIDVPDYHHILKGILIMNPYDDTLPRMGGASL